MLVYNVAVSAQDSHPPVCWFNAYMYIYLKQDA